MVSLEQIRALEARVEKAVVLIDKLRRENAELERNLDEALRSGEQVRTNGEELERKLQSAARAVAEAEARASELAARLKDAEDRAKEAELKYAEAGERAAAFERKALAAEAENATYRDRALAAEHKAAELEARAEDLRREQGRIEEGLSHALDKLDAFEDLVMGISAASPAVPEPAAEPIGGDIKVEAAVESPAAQATQPETFPGAGAAEPGPWGAQPSGDSNELDIF